MKKRFFSGLCAVLFALGLLSTSVPAHATGNPCFMAVNDNLLSLEDRFIPIVSNGQYYVPYLALDSNVTGLALGIFPIYNSMRNTLLIYSRDQVLSFDLATGVCTNRNNVVLSARSVTRNGQIYVPINFICDYFSLEVSVRSTTYGPLVRVRNASSILDDNTFVGLAQLLMEDRLRDWRASQGDTGTSSTTTPSNPSSTTPGNKSGVRVYLSYRADKTDGLNSLLDRLEQYQVQALFFFPASELAAYDDAVRAVLCRGHGVGLLALGTTAEEIAAQAAEGNRLLTQIAHLNTYTVLAPEAEGDAVYEQLNAAGLLCLEPDVDALADGTRASTQAATALKRIDRYSREVYVLSDASTGGAALTDRLLPELVQDRYDLRLAVESEL